MFDDTMCYSDEEPARSWENVSQTPVKPWQDYDMRFGKYRGQTLGEMILTGAGRSYMRYLLTWDDLRQHTRNAVEDALGAYTEAKMRRIRNNERTPHVSPQQSKKDLNSADHVERKEATYSSVLKEHLKEKHADAIAWAAKKEMLREPTPQMWRGTNVPIHALPRREEIASNDDPLPLSPPKLSREYSFMKK